MSRKPSLAFQSLLFLFHLARLLASANNGNSTQQICESLQEGRDEIQMLGIIKTRIVLITKTKFVIDLSIESLNSSTRQLHLEGAVERLHDKWPQVERLLSNDSAQALTVNDAQREFILVVAGEEGFVAVDIASNQVTPIRVHRQWPASAVLLSNNNPLTFNAIEHDGSTYLGSEYVFDGSNLLLNVENITLAWSGRLCHEKAGRLQLYQNQQCSGNEPDLDIRSGFVTEMQVYLFTGNQSVIIITKSSLDKEHEVDQVVHESSLSDFLVCSDKANLHFYANGNNLGDSDGSDDGSSDGGSNSMFIIIGIVVVLAVIGVAVYCFCCKKKKGGFGFKSNKSHKSKKSKNNEYRPETEQSKLECKRAAVFS